MGIQRGLNHCSSKLQRKRGMGKAPGTCKQSKSGATASPWYQREGAEGVVGKHHCGLAVERCGRLSAQCVHIENE